jgi:hypothetical protein
MRTGRPTVERIVRGSVFTRDLEGADFDALLDEDHIVLAGQPIDSKVEKGARSCSPQSRTYKSEKPRFQFPGERGFSIAYPSDSLTGVPNGIRTRVLALKGPRPGPD